MFGLGVKTVTVDQLAAKLALGTQVLIDVREPHEFIAGHVPSAVNVPLGRLAGAMGGLDPRAETFLICQSGNRSATAARMLARSGFQHAFSVKGGTSAWRGNLAR